MTAFPLDFIAARTPAESVDVLVTWVGAVTLLRYRVALGRRQERSVFERRTGYLVSVLAMLFFLRGFAWINPGHRWLGAIMLLPATMLPVAMTLFVEGLLRRHAPGIDGEEHAGVGFVLADVDAF